MRWCVGGEGGVGKLGRCNEGGWFGCGLARTGIPVAVPSCTTGWDGLARLGSENAQLVEPAEDPYDCIGQVGLLEGVFCKATCPSMEAVPARW